MSKAEWKWHNKGFRDIMKSSGMVDMLMNHVEQARDKAESNSGLRFGAGVDNDARRKVSARGWVGASSVDKRTGKPNAGLHKKQAEALKRVGW